MCMILLLLEMKDAPIFVDVRSRIMHICVDMNTHVRVGMYTYTCVCVY